MTARGTGRRLARRRGARIALPALAAALAATPALGVDIHMAVAAGPVACSAIAAGVADCDLSGAVPAQLTVTWSLDGAEVLNGYDLNVQWDPGELALASASQLFPDTQAPDTYAFQIAPDPLDPAGSRALRISLVAFQTTALFSLTFDVVGTLAADCAADVAWSANGNGLSPADLTLDNPAGAGVDLFEERECSDGLDNDGDGRIDFDGGACAGLPPELQTSPELHCTGAEDDREAAGSVCGLGPELALLLPALLGGRLLRRRRRA